MDRPRLPPSYRLVILDVDENGLVASELWADDGETLVSGGLSASLEDAWEGAVTTAHAHARLKIIGRA